MRHTQAGFNIVEATLVLAVVSTLLVIGLPLFSSWAAGVRVELAAGEILGVLNLARITAVRENTKVGVRFTKEGDGSTTYSMYVDGDGDGVRNQDIEVGIDRELRPPRSLVQFERRVGFGFPPGVHPTDPGNPRKRLERLDDPIRFNRSDLAVFNPNGTATPGTVYLTDGKLHLAAVRVNNRSGKISSLLYDPDTGLWR